MMTAIYAAAKDKATDDEVLAADFEISLEVSADTVYASTPVTVSVVLTTPYEVDIAQATGDFSFKNFDAEKISDGRFLGRRVVNGRRVNVYLLDAYKLTPAKSGTHKISCPEYKITAVTYRRVTDGFFVYNRPAEHILKIKGASARITVRPGTDPRIDTRRYPMSTAWVPQIVICRTSINA